MDEEVCRPKVSAPWWTWLTLLVPLAFLVWSGWMLLVAQESRQQDSGRAIAVGKLESLERALLQLQQGSIVLWRSPVASDSVARWRELYRNYRNQVKQLDGGDPATREVMEYLLRLYTAVGRTERIRQQLLTTTVAEDEARTLETEFRTKIDVGMAELKTAMLKLRMANATTDNLPLWTVFAIASASLALITAIILYLLGRQTGRLSAAEAELAENWRDARAVNARWQAVLNATPDAFLLSDDNGDVLAANLGAQNMLGFSLSELTGRPLSALIQASAQRNAPAPAPGDSSDSGNWAEAEARRRDGSTVKLDISTRKTTIEGRAATLTLLRPIGKGREESMLRAQRDFLNSVLETADVMLVVLDERGRVVSINGALERKTGLTFAQTKGQPFQKLFALEPLAGTPGRFPAPSGLCWVSRGEERRRILWHGSDLVGKGSSIRNVIALGVDLTDYLAAAAPPSQAAPGPPEEALGKLAVKVAQTLSDSLTAITGYSELLLNSLGADDPSRKDVEQILDASGRANTVTMRLLSFSQREILQPHTVDLNMRIEALRPRLCASAGQSILLATELDRGLGLVRIDPDRFDELLLILARNAGEAMLQGGKLTVRTANAKTAEGVLWVMVSVRDTGTGIDEETQKRLFEPFFTTKDPRKSLGLGLATARGIVAQSGGYIQVETAPGAGTNISILLPPVRRPAEPAPVGAGVSETQA